MVKALIIITIFICCSYVGFIYGDSFRKRFQDLKEVYKQITLLQNEVVFNNTPIPEALYALGKKGREPLGEILINTAEELMEGKAEGIYEAFKKSYLKKEEELYFTKEDKNV